MNKTAFRTKSAAMGILFRHITVGCSNPSSNLIKLFLKEIISIDGHGHMIHGHMMVMVHIKTMSRRFITDAVRLRVSKAELTLMNCFSLKCLDSCREQDFYSLIKK